MPAARAGNLASRRLNVTINSTQAPARTGMAHSTSAARPGATRTSIQAATPSIITPNSFFTVSIHGPALGSSLPCDAPTSSSGVPIPRLITNSAAAPRTI